MVGAPMVGPRGRSAWHFFRTSSAGRIARYLLERDAGRGLIPDGLFSGKLLARVLMLRPETISRVLVKFRRLGLVTAPPALRVLDEDGLREFADRDV